MAETDDDHDESVQNDAEDEDCFDFEALMGTRPPLPFVETLGNDYNTLIEIFYVCTNEMPDERPTASALNACLASALKRSED